MARPRRRTSPARSTQPVRRRGKFAGQRLAFFGRFAYWPSYHGGEPVDVARREDALIADRVDDGLDVLVLGDLRGPGRADAAKKAERLRQRSAANGGGRRPRVMSEAEYRELCAIDVKGKSFCVFGEFEHCPADFDESLLARMVESAGGRMVSEVSDALDYLVLGNRRGKGKTQAVRRAEELARAGAPLAVIGEEGFFELVRRESHPDDQVDFATMVGNLYATVDERKLMRALKMLRTEAFKLYAQLDAHRLIGVVRSQTDSRTVYAPWLTAEGRYGCSTADLVECMGLQGSPCKHLLVLLVGLARAGELEPARALKWVAAVGRRGPARDAELAAEAFLQYKGAEAGELDWRPTQTIPEDYYAL